MRVIVGIGFGLICFVATSVAATAPADASPITYNYALDVTASNIPGISDGTLSFTLSAAPTTTQESADANIAGEVTSFDAMLDGYTFNNVADLSNLEFQTGGTLRNLTFVGPSTTNSVVTLTTNNTTFSHFYIQTTGQYADGNIVFEDTSTPTMVPEPATLSLFGAGLAGLGFVGFVRRRGKVKSAP